MKLRFRFGTQEYDVTAAWAEDGVRITLPDRTITVELHRLDEHAFLLRENGRRISCAAAGTGRTRQLWVDGRTVSYESCDIRRPASAVARETELVAPMPGVVQDVLVAVGDHVREGDRLVVLESMKMELVVSAAYAGVVEAVFCTAGQNVEGGEHLVAITRADT